MCTTEREEGGGDDVVAFQLWEQTVGEGRGRASESSNARRIGIGKSFKLWPNSTPAASAMSSEAMVGAGGRCGVLPGRH